MPMNSEHAVFLDFTVCYHWILQYIGIIIRPDQCNIQINAQFY